jgi:hypothetical protein
MVEEKKIVSPHPLKGTYGVGCLTEWYQSRMREISHNREEESDERRAVETPLDLIEIVRSFMV